MTNKITPIVVAGLGILAAGYVAKVGTDLAKGISNEASTSNLKSKKSTGDSKLDYMLGYK